MSVRAAGLRGRRVDGDAGAPARGEQGLRNRRDGERTALTAARRGRGSSLTAQWIALAVLYGYGVALPLLAFAETRGGTARWALLAIAVYSGARIAYEIGRGARRWLVLSFHTFCLVFFGIAPLLQIGAGTLYWAALASDEVLTRAALVCVAGIAAFEVGLWAVLRRAKEHGESAAPGRTAAPSAAGAGRALAILMAFTAVSLLLFARIGGLGAVLASRAEMQAVMCPGTDLSVCGIVGAVVRVPPVILAIVAIVALRRRRGVLGWCALALGAVALLLTANPVSTARFWFGAIGVGLFGVLMARSQVSRILMWVAFPLLILLVFPVSDFARTAGWSGRVSLDPSAVVDKQDFDAFQQVANGVVYVDSFGNRNGAQLLSVALFFVPRSVWQEKAQPTGAMVTSAYGFQNTNVSVPPWEDGYVDFGMAGAVSLLFLLGLLVGALETHAAEWWSSSSIGPAFLPLAAGSGIILLRGSLLAFAGMVVASVLLVAIAVLSERGRLGTDTQSDSDNVREGRARSLGEPETAAAVAGGGGPTVDPMLQRGPQDWRGDVLRTNHAQDSKTP